MSAKPSGAGLAARLRAIGRARYHHLHPFHRALHSGELSRGQVRAWALNRYCYQAAIPVKDAVILSRMDDPALRREWRARLADHDGDGDSPGGVARWLALTDALGLPRELVASQRAALPAVKFAVGAYVNFVREKSLLEAVASSLTEMFAPKIIAERVSGMLAHYDFVGEDALAYFRPRLTQAPRDSEFALNYVVREAGDDPRLWKAAEDALRFKCDILWAQLDALSFAYVNPATPPPGAFVDDESGTTRQTTRKLARQPRPAAGGRKR